MSIQIQTTLEQEAALLRQLQGRERVAREAAFRRLFELHRGGVFALCFSLTGHRQDAEDATQEVFLGVLRGMERFRGDASLKTWIYRIALRQALRMRQRRQRQQKAALAAEAKGDPAMAGPPGEAPSAEEIAAALAALPSAQRSVLVLFSLQGLSQREIAEVLGVKEGTVWSRLHSARKKMGELLERQE